ncbi:MAG: ribosome small subunit-dependent GTPase A [Pseudomonadota bacterium]
MGKRPPTPPPQRDLLAGLVVASHGRQLDVESTDGARRSCRLHGRRLQAVCGDEVLWAHATTGDPQGTVYEVLPRRTLLERLDATGRTEPVVANLTQLVAVVAPQPAPDWYVVDRYLAGAAWAGLQALVAFNKDELAATPEASAELEAYVAIGYRIVRCSTRGVPGVESLAHELAGTTSVLVGQSGTGKSSLLNALVPEARAVTQEISAATEEGRHTTTTAALHRLASGGRLIDSPGVRDYAPALPAVRDVATGFREIHAIGAGCRFQDCRHETEPACAVREAVNGGTIRARRYESYRRLAELARHFATKYPERAPPRTPPGLRR